jgi:endo-1,4-beta-xylanase
MPTRRQTLMAFGAAATAAAITAPSFANAQHAEPAPIPSAYNPEQKLLKDLAGEKGIRFGAATGIGAFRRDPRQKEMLARECSIMVHENELKMYSVQNNRLGEFTFGAADEIMAFAQENKIPMRGHTLFWARDDYTPKWLLDYTFKDKAEAEKMLRDYVGKVADHYGDRITSWDVVNETVHPETGEMRSNVYSRVLGMDAIRIAFDEARQRLPKTQLVYNDFMSWEVGNGPHRDGVIKLLRWMRDNKVEINALGIQSHLGNGYDIMHPELTAWTKFLDDVVALDLDMIITEFDVCDQYVPTDDIEVRDTICATVGRIYLDQMLSYKQTKDVLFWTMPDHRNWLQGFRPRPDGKPLRPTIFDADYKKKPLYDALAESFIMASAR